MTFKYVSGSGSSVAVSPSTTKIVFASANDGVNPDIIDLGFGAGDVTLTGTQTLTNKTLTSPAIGTKFQTQTEMNYLILLQQVQQLTNLL